MRVTFNAIDKSVSAIQLAAEQFTRAQTQVATGTRIQAPSDDPSAAQRSVEARTELGVLDAYTRSGDSADARLTVIDGVLTALIDTLTEAQATAATARGTTADEPRREALVEQLRGQRDRVLGFLNSTFAGTYLFSGSETQTPAFAAVAGAWVYQGNADPVTVDVSSTRSVTTALDGRAIAQGGDAINVLTAFDNVVAAVQARDEAALEAGMAALHRTFDRAIRAQSQVGADQQGVAGERVTTARFRVAVQQRLARDEAADPVRAITEMTQARTAYEAALGAVGTASRQSLLDYLR